MISDTDLAHWRQWLGRSESRTERLDPEALRRFAAAQGADLDIEASPPPLAHWAFFLPVTRDLGPDGHPARGGFLPPVSLPRRMFLGAEMAFPAPLLLDVPATRTTTITGLDHKTGRSGELVLLTLDHRIEQAGATRITERQTIVYRDTGAPLPPVVPADPPLAGTVWTPDQVQLFRFSAATFNSHRIHYDLPYARDVEGYPGLVVHGPLTAAKLHALAGSPRRFAFRAQAPLFAGQPVTLTGENGHGHAIRCDGVVALTAEWGD